MKTKDTVSSAITPELLPEDDNSVSRQRDLHDEVHEIKSGDYWVNKETEEVRLVRSLNVIDGILHSVNVLPHPDSIGHFSDKGALQGKRAPVSFSLEEFLNAFMYVDQEEAKRIRELEIQNIQNDIKKESEELAKGYISDSGLNASQLLTDTSENIQTDMSLPISMAQDNTVVSIKENIKKTQEIAEKQTSFIQEKTANIAKKSVQVSLFYTEVAEQSLASIDGTLVFVNKLQEGIKTLNIFLGDGVELIPLVEGDKASDEEALTFYQRKLFLDEEFFYDLAGGGADHQSLPSFREALEKDFSIIERIAPSQKSVVLMQFRRFQKRNYGSSDTVDFFQEAMNWEHDKEMFLLIRNGGSVYLIFSEDIDGGERLFPTAKEINNIFRDEKNPSKLFEGATVDNSIHFKDLRNVKARKEFDRRARYYQRIILMLNGIHSRTDKVFGHIKDEAYRDWLSIEFQQKHFKFIYDDEDALMYNTKPLDIFVSEHNSRIQAGSRVVGLWSRIANEDNATGMWNNPMHYESSQIWYVINTDEPLLVMKDQKGLYVKVECSHRWDRDKKNRYFKVYFDSCDYMLCIDYVKAEDIEYYFNSRHARASYADFAYLLLGARDFLREEEKRAKPMVMELKKHISALYSELDEDVVEEKLFESVAFWRVSNKGKPIPMLGENNYSKMVKSVSDIFYSKTLGDKTSILKEYMREHVRSPLCISTNNKGTYYIYSIVSKEDYVPLGAFDNYPFVWRHTLKVNTKGVKSEKSEQVVYREQCRYIGEEILHLERAYDGENIFNINDEHYVQKIEKLKETTDKGNSLLSKLEKGGKEIDSLLTVYLEEKETIQENGYHHHILPYTLSVIVGAYLYCQVKGKDGCYYMGSKKDLYIVEQYTNIDLLVARYGSDTLFSRMVKWIDKKYSSPSRTISSLTSVRKHKKCVFKTNIEPIWLERASVPNVKSENGFLVGDKTFCGNKRSQGITNELGVAEVRPVETFNEVVKRKSEGIDVERDGTKRFEIIVL